MDTRSYTVLSAIARIWACCWVCFATAAFAAPPKTISLYTPEQIEPLKKREGLLLIDLDVAGTAPSLIFVRMGNGAEDYLKPGQKAVRTGKPMKLDLKGKEAGLYLAKLPPGLYQISQINAPFFDLPYKLSTDFARSWRFNITADAVNYAGKLSISQTRGTDYIDVDLRNRFATDYDAIVEVGQRLQEPLAVLLATGVRDDFQTFIE